MTDRFTIEIVPSPVYEIELTGRGPQGMQGPKGDTGATGAAGPAGPQGPKGDKGDPALTFTVGETTELPTSDSAYVENVGTNQDIVLDFGIPRGLTGASGKGVDIGSIIQSLSKVAPDGFVHTWGESISQEENPELYQACLDGTLPTVNANNGGASTIYAPNGIFKLTPGTNTFEINSNVVMELAKIGGVVNWNGSYNPQPTGNLTLASFRPTVLTHIMMFTEGGLNETHFRLIEGSYLGKLSEHPEYSSVNDIYFNTTDKTYYIYEGGDWNQYGAEGVGYIYLGAVLFSGDASTMTWGPAVFYPNPDVTTTGLSEYDQQLVANKGNCGYFGLDTTELSVRVPTMQNVFLEENDTEVGSYKEAGLPNIDGMLETRPNGDGTAGQYTNVPIAVDGAFSGIGTANGTSTVASVDLTNGANRATDTISFDASVSNPIYGNSDTVQPEAIAVYFYVCVSKYTELEQGPYFTPHIDSNGILSWTNNGGLVNPPNVDIKGPKGDDAFTLSIGEVTTLNPDQQATVTNVGTTSNQVWDIAIPRGETGDVSDKANISLDNLNSEGMNIANWSTNVTNCITEIPQDIKLELNDGVLTLKAGSKVYVPNGFEADGITPKFDEVVIESDITFGFGTGNGTWFLSIDNLGTVQKGFYSQSQIHSGSTKPNDTTNKYQLWYDTASNIIKVSYDTGATFGNSLALLLGVVTVSAGVVTSIDQTFNGFGFIGSTIFVLPNVKGLIPNGRNEDGSLNNIEVVTGNVTTLTSTSTFNFDLALYPNGLINTTNIANSRNDEKNNYYYTGSTRLQSMSLGTGSFTTSGVSSLNPKLPFRAMDYSEFNSAPHITETYQNGTSGYIVYSNGYCEQWGRVNINFTPNNYNDYTIALLKGYKNTDYNILAFAMDRGNVHVSNIAYSTITRTNWVLRAYTQGDTQNNKTACWRTCGYII